MHTQHILCSQIPKTPDQLLYVLVELFYPLFNPRSEVESGGARAYKIFYWLSTLEKSFSQGSD
jgi:hypothetical protein